jgi:hypothetical protein
MKNFKLMTVMIMTALLAVSCIVDDEVDNGFADTPRVVGFPSPFASVAYFEDLGAIQREFPINLIGGADGSVSSTPITVNFAVDASSTATEGVEFDFVNPTNSVVIPAGSTFANLPILVNTANLNPTMKTTLTLNITSVNEAGSVVSSLNGKFDVIFVGCQSTIDNFTYNCAISRDDGAQWNHGTQGYTVQDINTFKSQTTGGWAEGTIAPDQGMTFIDICGDITVPLQGLAQGFYSNEVKGLTTDGTDGEVFDNGDIEIVYQIDFAAGARVYTNYYTKL